MPRKLAISAECFQPSATMLDTRLWKKPFVYIIRANRKQRRTPSGGGKYKKSGSRIIYIGVTERRGGIRSADSLAGIAERAFTELPGVKSLWVHLTKCARRRNVKTWRQLESGLLRTFNEIYGALPYYNRNLGAKPTKRAQFDAGRLEAIITDLS